MKRLIERFVVVASAAAFAEEGEFETARAMMREGSRDNVRRLPRRPAGRKAAAGSKR